MPTDNPKVSAYVPQALKDRLTQFRQEQGNISESQAVTIVLSEYFGIPTNVNSASEGVAVGCVTPARLEQLESQVAILTSTIEEIKSSLLSRPIVDQLEQTNQEEEMETESSLDSEPYQETTEENQADSSSSINLPSESLHINNPISGTVLSTNRFGLAKDTVAGKKKNSSAQKFIEWSKKVDPDNIAWKPVAGSVKGYMPDGELTSEQKSRLLKWMTKNNLT